MYTVTLVIHVIICILLVLIILMQPGKGADISSAFGGGSASQLFGAAGPGTILTRSTGAFAAIFMVTSIILALYSTEARQGGLDGAEDIEDVEEGSGFGVNPPVTPPPAEPTPAPANP